MIIIGLTGASGSGKSSVSKIFLNFGAVILDADEIYHTLLQNSVEMKKEIAQNFQLLHTKIDTKKLGKIVFNDKDKLLMLNKITHKYVTLEFEKKMIEINTNLLILDVPLLFEANFDKYCKKTIGVIASEQNKIDRICKRDNISQEYAKNRLKNQKSNDFFMQKCDIIIENDSSLDNLYKKCDDVYRTIGE